MKRSRSKIVLAAGFVAAVLFASSFATGPRSLEKKFLSYMHKSEAATSTQSRASDEPFKSKAFDEAGNQNDVRIIAACLFATEAYLSVYSQTRDEVYQQG